MILIGVYGLDQFNKIMVIEKCYKYTNPASGRHVFIKHSGKSVVIYNEDFNSISIKPRHWLMDKPELREKQIQTDRFNAVVARFMQELTKEL